MTNDENYGAKYEALNIANYVVYYSNKNRYSISNLRLQKLLYFIQAYFLYSFGKACFKDEIEAWAFGPVVPEVYHKYKKYGAGSIPYLNYDGAEIFNINNSDKEAINLVIKKLSKYSVYDLVEATHKQGPWESVYDKNTRSAIISKESIKDYFNA